MPGIANISVGEFRRRLNRFPKRDVNDWDQWVRTHPNQKDTQVGSVLRKWGACRPNKMRRSKVEQQHDAPYVEDLVAKAKPHVHTLRRFDIRRSFSREAVTSLRRLWMIFENLSYDGPARGGRAGVVGISKAVFLLTNGRVGPAFDSRIRRQLGIRQVKNAEDWIEGLKLATTDIQQFETANQITLRAAAPRQYTNLHSGRLYDMALWSA